VTDAEQRLTPGTRRLAQVVDIQALRIAQSLGRSGGSTSTDERVEENDPEQTDQLAS
jgi:hypothetical protein